MMLLFCFTIYSTLFAKNHLASTVISLSASKVEYIVRQNNNIFLAKKIMLRLLVILFVIKLYARTDIFKNNFI